MLIQHNIIQDYHCSHRFYDRHSARNNAWVVASVSLQNGRIASRIDGFLLLQYGCSRFERRAEVYVFAVAYSALYAPAMVG